MNDSVVVYFYSDPAYGGDLTSAVKTLKERGFRVVKGDNADELLFLLQVGRPAAVIYTLASTRARSSAAYQMVSRRALDLLVPIFLLGPEEPRDGLVLVMPAGKGGKESHIPFHSMPELIARFHSDPPSTPSRPPDVLHEQTVGKGRTLHSWQGQGSIAPQDPRESKKAKRTLLGVPAPAAETARKTVPGKLASGTKTRRMTVEPSAEPPAQALPEDVATGATIQMLAAAVPPPSAEPPEAASQERGEVVEVESAREPAPERTGDLPVYPPDPFENKHEKKARRKADPRGGGGKTLGVRIAVIVSAVAVLAAIVVVVYLATRPSGKPPQPLPRGVAIPAGPVSPASGRTAGDGQRVAEKTPAEVPADTVLETPPPVAEEPEVETEEAGREEAPPQPPAGEMQRPKVRPSLERTEDGAYLFPGHFREETATFWFLDEQEEAGFISRIESGGGTIRVIGHPTLDEAEGGKHGLGLSRAWAVEKYLIRKGVSPDRIETERGAPVDPKDDIDERGWARNRWVDVHL